MLCITRHKYGNSLFTRDVLSAIPFYLMNKLNNCFINVVVFRIKVEVITLICYVLDVNLGIMVQVCYKFVYYHAIIYLIVQLIRLVRRTGSQSSVTLTMYFFSCTSCVWV